MTLSQKKFGFIGMGKMAEAIFLGLIDAFSIPKSRCVFYEIDEVRRAYIENEAHIKGVSLSEIGQTDYLFFCVKPQNIKGLLHDFPPLHGDHRPVMVTILAGTPISVFEAKFGVNQPVVRVMPNTPALLRAGMSVLAQNNAVSTAQFAAVSAIFAGLGKTLAVPEALIDVVTGVSGSGPAFFYRIAHQVAKTAEAEGMSYDDALICAAQTMVGAGEMLLQTNKSAATLIKEVSSPNGTTIAGLNAFDRTQIDTEIRSVVEASITRARELAAES